MQILILDTETLGNSSKQVFDFAWVTFDTETQTLKEKAEFRILETLLFPYAHNESFHSSHFEQSKRAECIAPLDTVMNAFYSAIQGADKVCAFNSPFDIGAINNTLKTHCRPFLAIQKPVFCLMSLAQLNLCQTEQYRQFCLESGFITETGNYRYNAESIISYIRGGSFKTEHTALADCINQLDILKALLDYGYL